MVPRATLSRVDIGVRNGAGHGAQFSTTWLIEGEIG
jgi:hypothetical protein